MSVAICCPEIGRMAESGAAALVMTGAGARGTGQDLVQITAGERVGPGHDGAPVLRVRARQANAQQAPRALLRPQASARFQLAGNGVWPPAGQTRATPLRDRQR